LQDDSAVTKQKKDAEANWKSQVSFLFSFCFLVKIFVFFFNKKSGVLLLIEKKMWVFVVDVLFCRN
jgi:hypothetical protein